MFLRISWKITDFFKYISKMKAYSDLLTQATQESAEKLMLEAEVTKLFSFFLVRISFKSCLPSPKKKGIGASAVVRVRFQNSSTADPISGISIYSRNTNPPTFKQKKAQLFCLCGK